MTVAEAVGALRRGRLIHLPTETVYGLAADAGNAASVAAVFAAKARPQFNPLIAHVSSTIAAQGIADFDERAKALAAAFWPGPLTLVCPLTDQNMVCDLALAGLNSVAVRVPAHALALEVLEAFGRPVVAPSANRSGRPSPTTVGDALEETGAQVDVSLDGGPCRVGLESTVVAVLPGSAVRILRPGGITRGAIEALMGPLDENSADGHRSPGRLTLHYAPNAPVRLMAQSAKPGEIWLGFGPGTGTMFNLSPSGDVEEAASHLFSMLRAADRLAPSAIAVSPIPDIGLGEAINDRLRRAAGWIG